MAIVYRHIRLDTKKPIYIGIGKTEKRAHSTESRNPYWKNIVAKTDYRVEILFSDLTWEEACEKEKEFIKLYGRMDLGTGTLCNMTDGGEGVLGRIVSHHTKKKIGDAQKGEKNHSFGKKHNIERRKKQSEKMKGRKLTDDHIQKMKEGNVGRKMKPRTEKHSFLQSLSHQKEPKIRYRQDRNCWFVRFRRYGKIIYLGHHKSKEQAQEAIDKWLLQNKT